jgi:hypothetical protein
MYDTIYNNQFPANAEAYAAYVDGGLGNQPNYAYIVNTFPKAQHVSISLSSGVNADALDVEEGAATAGEFPAWCARQRSRGIQRPIVYASVSAMQDSILPVLSANKIARSTVRLWTAHYGLGQHICGPSSCGALSTGADGTQWTSSALGLVLDESELQSNFFTVSPTSGPIAEAELESGELNTGKNAITAIAVAPGTAHHIGFGCDNGVAASQPAVLRVAIYDTGWHITQNVVVDGSKGLHVMTFPNPAKTGVVSVVRMDAAGFPVGYVVY